MISLVLLKESFDVFNLKGREKQRSRVNSKWVDIQKYMLITEEMFS